MRNLQIGQQIANQSLSYLSFSLALIFSRSFLLRTTPHYLNAWNRRKVIEPMRTLYLRRASPEALKCRASDLPHN